MIRNKLLYLALIFVMVLFFILYRGILSLELLIFTLALPVLLWLMLTILRYSLKVQLRHSKGAIKKGDAYQWILQIKNNSPFPSPYALAEVEYLCNLGGAPQPLRLRVPVVALNTGRMRLSFHAMICGAMELHVNKLIIYDPLRLFRRTLKLNLADRILIAPEPELSLPENWEPNLQMDDDAVEYSKEKPGDDPSEIFDLHEYRAGDSVSRIHWKLSSKLDQLMVKDYSLPLTSAYLLVCDYRHTASQPESALRLDAMLSAAERFADEMNQRHIGHRFVLFDPDYGCSESALLTEPDDSAAWMQHILTQQPLPEKARDGFLANLAEYLTEGHAADRVAVFLPRADEAMLDALSALPKPDRILVIAAVHLREQKRLLDLALPFEIIPVSIRSLSSEPVFLTNDPAENEVSEDEEEAVL